MQEVTVTTLNQIPKFWGNLGQKSALAPFQGFMTFFLVISNLYIPSGTKKKPHFRRFFFTPPNRLVITLCDNMNLINIDFYLCFIWNILGATRSKRSSWYSLPFFTRSKCILDFKTLRIVSTSSFAQRSLCCNVVFFLFMVANLYIILLHCTEVVGHCHGPQSGNWRE